MDDATVRRVNNGDDYKDFATRRFSAVVIEEALDLVDELIKHAAMDERSRAEMEADLESEKEKS
jgi:hypothetical protein